ncbi:MAG: hypothetical protein JXR63_08175 [Spirochaetales bacterium]|nr:hypothetical protein [Spirochaetales bacterium]
MAKKGKVKMGLRILLWVLVDIALVLVMLFVFNIMGIVDIRKTVSGMKNRITNSDVEISSELQDFNILDSERLEQQLKVIKIRDEELALRETELNKLEIELNQRFAKIEEEQKALEEREIEIKKRENNVEERSKTIDRLATRFTSMVPDAAVAIFLEMDDRDLIDIFRVVEERALVEERASLVPVWLSSLPPERAAQIKRKMLSEVN